MKKIALCLSGGLRNFKDTFYSFKYFLLDKHNVDVFFFGLENKDGQIENEKDLINLYNPINFKINTEKYYKNIECKINPKSSYYSFYNVFKCNELKIKYENENLFKYDYVIRSRLDYFWFREVTEEEFFLAKKYILTPKEWSFKNVNNFAKSDIFAIGSSNLIDDYSTLFSKIDEYVNLFPFHPETYCGFHLQKNNIPILEINRHVIFEYPSKRIEKYITPHKFIKYFEEPDIFEENDFLKEAANRRKNF